MRQKKREWSGSLYCLWNQKLCPHQRYCQWLICNFVSDVDCVLPVKTAESLRAESDFVSYRAFSHDVTSGGSRPWAIFVPKMGRAPPLDPQLVTAAILWFQSHVCASIACVELASLPTQSCGSVTRTLCKHFHLFQSICICAGNAEENSTWFPNSKGLVKDFFWTFSILAASNRDNGLCFNYERKCQS